ncbi:hypothetical protein ElyMa_000770800 [Elysia marginata]|uniref:Uncharacterized protein n=1 Tax=Elysia marginata TaxID=1093978 RepID=A0AAV4GSY2_9GAST|nr:hypothetical protein ElyMa_000770800 [Elysia marginata]
MKLIQHLYKTYTKTTDGSWVYQFSQNVANLERVEKKKKHLQRNTLEDKEAIMILTTAHAAPIMPSRWSEPAGRAGVKFLKGPKAISCSVFLARPTGVHPCNCNVQTSRDLALHRFRATGP